MKKLLLAAYVAVFALGAQAQASQPNPDYFGTWKIDERFKKYEFTITADSLAVRWTDAAGAVGYTAAITGWEKFINGDEGVAETTFLGKVLPGRKSTARDYPTGCTIRGTVETVDAERDKFVPKRGETAEYHLYLHTGRDTMMVAGLGKLVRQHETDNKKKR